MKKERNLTTCPWDVKMTQLKKLFKNSIGTKIISWIPIIIFFVFLIIVCVIGFPLASNAYHGTQLSEGQRLVLDKLFTALFGLLAFGSSLFIVDVIKRKFDDRAATRRILWEALPDIKEKYSRAYSSVIAAINRQKTDKTIQVSKSSTAFRWNARQFPEIRRTQRACREFLVTLDKRSTFIDRGIYMKLSFVGQVMLTTTDCIYGKKMPAAIMDLEAFIIYLNSLCEDLFLALEKDSIPESLTWYRDEGHLPWHYDQSAVDTVIDAISSWKKEGSSKIFIEFAGKYSSPKTKKGK